MRYSLITAIFHAFILAGQPAVATDLGDFTKKWLKDQVAQPGDKRSSAGSLSNEDIIAGLKEALQQGVGFSIENLGREDGFLANDLVRIPLPDSLDAVEKGLRRLGQGRYADEFITTMNRAAERAVPETAALLVQAIRAMTLEDAAAILQGDENAATEYFRANSEHALIEKITPIVKRATDAAGVTSAWKALSKRSQGLFKIPGLSSFQTNSDALDLDRYITGKAVDGLFTMIAAEEKRIRQNPVSRTTELLKKIFR